MVELTRRRLNEDFESWGIFYGDVRVGRISHLPGMGSQMIWQWSCGFYPGCNPGQQSAGNEDTIENARVAFQVAWQTLRPEITSAMINEWRARQAFTAWKYAMWDGGRKLPTQTTTGKSRCFCCIEINMAGVPDHIQRKHSSKSAAN